MPAKQCHVFAIFYRRKSKWKTVFYKLKLAPCGTNLLPSSSYTVYNLKLNQSGILSFQVLKGNFVASQVLSYFQKT